ATGAAAGGSESPSSASRESGELTVMIVTSLGDKICASVGETVISRCVRRNVGFDRETFLHGVRANCGSLRRCDLRSDAVSRAGGGCANLAAGACAAPRGLRSLLAQGRWRQGAQRGARANHLRLLGLGLRRLYPERPPADAIATAGRRGAG